MWRGGQSAMDPRLGLSARVELPLLNLSTLCRPAESDLTARVSCNADENETQKVQAYQMIGNCLGIIRLDCLGLASAKRAETFGCKVSYCAR
ncbi:unnamed protein product [Sphagnum jensenii]|uniref:Uncharacterized protein n=1 Tax=Sphagnum jensenii TaxID=128206 RepID=A0ABP0X1V3_9BRYO